MLQEVFWAQGVVKSLTPRYVLIPKLKTWPSGSGFQLGTYTSGSGFLGAPAWHGYDAAASARSAEYSARKSQEAWLDATAAAQTAKDATEEAKGAVQNILKGHSCTSGIGKRKDAASDSDEDLSNRVKGRGYF